MTVQFCPGAVSEHVFTYTLAMSFHAARRRVLERAFRAECGGVCQCLLFAPASKHSVVLARKILVARLVRYQCWSGFCVLVWLGLQYMRAAVFG